MNDKCSNQLLSIITHLGSVGGVVNFLLEYFTHLGNVEEFDNEQLLLLEGQTWYEITSLGEHIQQIEHSKDNVHVLG